MDVQSIRELAGRLRGQVGQVVVGQERTVDLMLVALLSQGHVLLEGVPGTAKTLLARTFAACLSLQFRRIQFTPDLMPGDVLGTNVFDFQANRFHLVKGPIFTQLLLADEINRTPPKTQAALLEAMQERAVTLDGASHDLGGGFMVIATQNPIEQEGTYPLPEAQLDRFLFKIRVGYPAKEAEQAMVRLHGTRTAALALAEFGLVPVADVKALEEARSSVAAVRLTDDLVAYVVDVVRATRGRPTLLCGASPRAAAMLASAARALAVMRGRDFVIPDDVKDLCVPALGHRLLLAPGAEIEGISSEAVVRQVLDEVAAPR
jgi:MoxR-like ATPase